MPAKLTVIEGGVPDVEKRLKDTLAYASKRVSEEAAFSGVIIILENKHGFPPSLVTFSANESGHGILGLMERAKLTYLDNPGAEVSDEDDAI